MLQIRDLSQLLQILKRLKIRHYSKSRVFFRYYNRTRKEPCSGFRQIWDPTLCHLVSWGLFIITQGARFFIWQVQIITPLAQGSNGLTYAKRLAKCPTESKSSIDNGCYDYTSRESLHQRALHNFLTNTSLP